MRKLLCLISMLALNELAYADAWKMHPLALATRWASLVNPRSPLPEYPRPQLVRGHWKSLNGLWKFNITPKGAGAPTSYPGKILVPYPIESALSGVQRALQPDEWLWYRRTMPMLPPHDGQRTLLHFGAVDYEATLYVNGNEAGTHTGGYQAFTFDITPYVRTGANDIVVRVYDPTDTGPNPHWKQTLHPHGDMFTASSGIWQSVWLENVPAVHIERLTLTPDIDRGELRIEVTLQGKHRDGYRIRATARSGSTVVARQSLEDPGVLVIPHPHLWSPDDPYLYDLQVQLFQRGTLVDEVKSYFGLRKVEVRKDESGISRIFVNNRALYHHGVLQVGYWPEGLYTAPTDAALRFDVQAAKAMGFNTIRKHVKLEPERWYYHCDRLGIIVWQDMVPPADGSPESRSEFEHEVQANIEQLYNHPSIMMWTLFNEEQGAYDKARLVHWVHTLDGSRLVNAHSGYAVMRMVDWMNRLEPSDAVRAFGSDPSIFQRWAQSREAMETDTSGGDVSDAHSYPEPMLPPVTPVQVAVAGEYGGLEYLVDGHLWDETLPPYDNVQPEKSLADFARRYAGFIETLRVLKAGGLSGSVYTVPYDEEGELAGLMTYDRARIKIPVAELARLNATLVPRAANATAATAGFSIKNADATPERDQDTRLFAEYQRGRRDGPFLRHLALVALRLEDPAHATEVVDEVLAREPQPYSVEAWRFIRAAARSPKDRAFGILRAQSRQADKALSDNAAEIRILEILRHEFIDPQFAASAAPDWPRLESMLASEFGPLGSEAAFGGEMRYYESKGDWARFGEYYVRYFSTASARSAYPINNFSISVLKHITDPVVLSTAIKTTGDSVGTFRENPELRSYAIELDTYANLLYKAGHVREAIGQQEQAVGLSEGKDRALAERLEQMRSGQPTWLGNEP